MQEKSAIWATPRPLLIGLYAKNRRGGHNVPPPLSNRVNRRVHGRGQEEQAGDRDVNTGTAEEYTITKH